MSLGITNFLPVLGLVFVGLVGTDGFALDGDLAVTFSYVGSGFLRFVGGFETCLNGAMIDLGSADTTAVLLLVVLCSRGGDMTTIK